MISRRRSLLDVTIEMDQEINFKWIEEELVNMRFKTFRKINHDIAARGASEKI